MLPLLKQVDLSHSVTSLVRLNIVDFFIVVLSEHHWDVNVSLLIVDSKSYSNFTLNWTSWDCVCFCCCKANKANLSECWLQLSKTWCHSAETCHVLYITVNQKCLWMENKLCSLIFSMIMKDRAVVQFLCHISYNSEQVDTFFLNSYLN